MQKRNNVDKRTIVLKISTYKRLEKYMIKVINEKDTPQLSFDDVINSMLDKVL